MKLAASFDVVKFRNTPPEVVQAAGEPDEPAAPKPKFEGVEDGNTLQPGIPEGGGDTAVHATSHHGTIHAEAIAHARAVINLCRLAGHRQMAGRFLEEHIALDEVSIQLLAVKAEATRISPRHMPDLDARPCTNASPSTATTQSKSSSRMQSSGFIKNSAQRIKNPSK